MKISVVIPAYNAQAFIGAAINSVLSQSIMPDEILVYDDGSNDNTKSILKKFTSHVTVFRSQNMGVAHARNYLCEQAKGDIIAFLDADDIWSPYHLEIQKMLIKNYPTAVAFFVDHINFWGFDNYCWDIRYEDLKIQPELFQPLQFLKQYNKTPMKFQLSGCSISKKILLAIGKEPFKFSGAEDTYLQNLLPLLGPILYVSEPLVAYRITNSSLSVNMVKNSALIVAALKLLDEKYQGIDNFELFNAFRLAFASRRRQCGKFLMGAYREEEARMEFVESLKLTKNYISVVKSLGLFLTTFMPKILQPKWPPAIRVSNNPTEMNDRVG